MAFSAGTYSLPGAALNTGDTVSATENNTLRNDMATAFNKTWLRDGTAAATADIPLGGFKLTGIAAATTTGDALSYGRTASVTDLTYTTTLTGGTGIVNLGSGQFYKDASGNVGIGTSSPATNLEVVGNTSLKASGSSNALYWRDNAGTYIADITGTGGTSFALESRTAIPMTFGTNSAERMRIDSSGNLLVGTTTVSNSSRVTFANFGSGIANGLGFLSSNTSSVGAVTFQNPNGNIGAINISGSTTSYVTSSDYRLKENVQPMTGALAAVTQLKPVTYKWKVDGSDGQGFIAHELQAVVPECVTGEKDAVDTEGNPKYQGIDTSFLVATLTAAIQEQQALITTLIERISALEAK
jgi:hypothetical protein